MRTSTEAAGNAMLALAMYVEEQGFYIAEVVVRRKEGLSFQSIHGVPFVVKGKSVKVQP